MEIACKWAIQTPMEVLMDSLREPMPKNVRSRFAGGSRCMGSEARWLDMTVIRVLRPRATNKERDPRESWFVWVGDQQADVAEVAMGYALRFSQEHGYRFDKQALLWQEPRLHSPEQ